MVIFIMNHCGANSKFELFQMPSFILTFASCTLIINLK